MSKLLNANEMQLHARCRARNYLLGSGVIAAVLTAATPALAQTDGDTGPRLEEIVVTAQKRSEPLQRTALAISAVSADRHRAEPDDDIGQRQQFASDHSRSRHWRCGAHPDG